MIEKYQEVINQANRYSKLIIDKIPQEKTLQLKDFIDINTGKLNANQSDENGIYPFFTCSENKSFINTYAFDCEAILVSGNGSQLGYTNYYQGKFNAYQRTYVLTGSKWFYIWYYALKFNIHEITSQAIGSAIPYLTKPMFEDFKIDVYQDDNINNALNENLKQITNLIFKTQYKIESLEKAKKQLLQKYFG